MFGSQEEKGKRQAYMYYRVFFGVTKELTQAFTTICDNNTPEVRKEIFRTKESSSRRRTYCKS
jgi:hypothetical protein